MWHFFGMFIGSNCRITFVIKFHFQEERIHTKSTSWLEIRDAREWLRSLTVAPPGEICIDFSNFLRKTYEPTHEIMAHIAVRKLNLQTRMRSNPLWLHVWHLGRSFVYFHTLCVRTAEALGRLRGCAVSPEPSLFAYAKSTIISWAGSYAHQGKVYLFLLRIKAFFWPFFHFI